MIKHYNDPNFNANAYADSLGDRLVPTSGQRYQIVEHIPDAVTDASKQTTSLDWHTDGLYYEKAPRYVLLHCIDPGSSYMATEFCDAHVILAKLPKYIKFTLDRLQINYISKRGVYQHYPIISDKIFNYTARGFISPINPEDLVNMPTVREMNEAIAVLTKLMDENVVLSHQWKKHDILIFDQHRVIHRRLSGVGDPERKLTRMWWN